MLSRSAARRWHRFVQAKNKGGSHSLRPRSEYCCCLGRAFVKGGFLFLLLLFGRELLGHSLVQLLRINAEALRRAKQYVAVGVPATPISRFEQGDFEE